MGLTDGKKEKQADAGVLCFGNWVSVNSHNRKGQEAAQKGL